MVFATVYIKKRPYFGCPDLMFALMSAMMSALMTVVKSTLMSNEMLRLSPHPVRLLI
jgi:hypothetical protein